MQMRCLMTSSTQHRQSKLPQIRNIPSNNCAYWNVPFVLAYIYSCKVPAQSTYYGISGVDDVIRYLICIFLKPRYRLTFHRRIPNSKDSPNPNSNLNPNPYDNALF